MSAPSLDHDTIMHAVQQWPREQQLELAREILQAAATNTPRPAPSQDSWQRLVGILATDQPAPSDEEIERWREERREQKYGR